FEYFIDSESGRRSSSSGIRVSLGEPGLRAGGAGRKANLGRPSSRRDQGDGRQGEREGNRGEGGCRGAADLRKESRIPAHDQGAGRRRRTRNSNCLFLF